MRKRLAKPARSDICLEKLFMEFFFICINVHSIFTNPNNFIKSPAFFQEFAKFNCTGDKKSRIICALAYNPVAIGRFGKKLAFI